MMTEKFGNSTSKRKHHDQKHCQPWEEMDEFKDWLQQSNKGEYFSYCQICNKHLATGINDLKRHGTTKKHLKACLSSSLKTDKLSQNLHTSHKSHLSDSQKIKHKKTNNKKKRLSSPIQDNHVPQTPEAETEEDISSSPQQQNVDVFPAKLYDQNFASGIWVDEEPIGSSSLYFQSVRTPREKTGISTISNLVDKFKVTLEVSQFNPEDLKVRVIGTVLEIEGKHEERLDEHGPVFRHFLRKYFLPDDVVIELINSYMNADGELTVEVPKKILYQERLSEINLPIHQVMS